MYHYFKADLFRIYKEHKLILSLGLLLTLSLLSALLLHGNDSYTFSVIQLLSQFITLFFLVPANLYFGEDFSNRTINNIIIKQAHRNQIFFYKVFSALILNLIYVFIAYMSSSVLGMVLSDSVDIHLVFTIFVHQLPMFLCISLLCILLFLVFKKVTQSYLTYILICLLFDNLFHLVSSNVLQLNLPLDTFLFLSLQNAESLSLLTTLLSLIFFVIYLSLSYWIFKNKAFK